MERTLLEKRNVKGKLNDFFSNIEKVANFYKIILPQINSSIKVAKILCIEL